MGALKRPGGVCRLGPRGEFLDTTGMSHPGCATTDLPAPPHPETRTGPLFRYKLHQDTDLFDRAYNYIREYY